jgi:hypothetical protein
MNAIAFIAQEKDGTIKIPSKYRKNLTKKFKVIILMENEKATKTSKKKFSAIKVKTKEFQFDREEAHER